MSLSVERLASLTDTQLAAVHGLVARSPGAADNPPLSESAMLGLGLAAGVTHLTATAGASSDLVGYAQVRDGTVEFVTAPGVQSAQVASMLLAAANEFAAEALLWAHGEYSSAALFAHGAGWRPVRSLLQLRRPLSGSFQADPATDAAISIRTFRPGVDDADWLELNATAFAHHPEQGGWTQADLTERLRSDWFDPEGFFLAERDGSLVGYHWTKVHRHHPPIGEVYVLGVHPEAQGQRLGQTLLNAGLHYLQELRPAGMPLSSVLLYVDGDNAAARRLYEKAGFVVYSQDTQYSRR